MPGFLIFSNVGGSNVWCTRVSKFGWRKGLLNWESKYIIYYLIELKNEKWHFPIEASYIHRSQPPSTCCNKLFQEKVISIFWLDSWEIYNVVITDILVFWMTLNSKTYKSWSLVTIFLYQNRIGRFDGRSPELTEIV